MLFRQVCLERSLRFPELHSAHCSFLAGIPVAVPNLCPEDFGQSFESTDSSLVPAGVTIDQSLTKLFQCMTLAYRYTPRLNPESSYNRSTACTIPSFCFLNLISSKLTSPRWKNFKGLRLQWKDKIRLNNLIWRCWHMQCNKYPSILMY